MNKYSNYCFFNIYKNALLLLFVFLTGYISYMPSAEAHVNYFQSTDHKSVVENNRVDKLDTPSSIFNEIPSYKKDKDALNLPLPPEEAFHLNASVIKGEVVLEWKIKKGYYLYRDHLHIYNTVDSPIHLEPYTTSDSIEIKDPYFGLSHIFLNSATVYIPFEKIENNKKFQFMMEYQGCKKNAVCYPPITKKITVSLKNYTTVLSLLSSLPSEHGVEIKNISTIQNKFQDEISQKNDSHLVHSSTVSKITDSQSQNINNKKPSHFSIIVLLGFLLSGILLSFTPCVFPMVPILLGIISNNIEKDSKKGFSLKTFWLSLVYVLSSTVIFTLMGVIAGLLGSGIQYIFQSPWFIIPFALLFIVLSLSMFGLYEIRLPSRWNNKINNLSNNQKGGSIVGVIIMGLLSGLIVGPCVTAPLTAAILYIAQSGSVLFGAMALFLLGLGMGLPLILLGTFFGNVLPRAGSWMNQVQKIFGVAFIGLSIWFLSRILSDTWIMLLIGILFIGVGVFLYPVYSSHKKAPYKINWRKLKIILALLCLLWGTSEIIGFSMGHKNIVMPLKNHSSLSVNKNTLSNANTIYFQDISNKEQLNQSIQDSILNKKPVLLDFYADWCVECKRMEATTFKNKEVAQLMNKFTLLRVDVTRMTQDKKELLNKFHLFGPPGIIFYDKKGRLLKDKKFIGYEKAQSFKHRLVSVWLIKQKVHAPV